MSPKLSKLSELLPRLGLAVVFAYFGIHAIIDPAGQGAAWIQRPIADIITLVISIETFMTLFGIMQSALAIGAAVKLLPQYVFALMAVLLLGIIVNLSVSFGFLNDIVMRDIALLFVAIGLTIKYWPIKNENL